MVVIGAKRSLASREGKRGGAPRNHRAALVVMSTVRRIWKVRIASFSRFSGHEKDKVFGKLARRLVKVKKPVKLQ